MTSRKIYVASSWRNAYQPTVVYALRTSGHKVYDFRNPTVGVDNPNGLAHGFHWSDIDSDWENWNLEMYVNALTTQLANQGFDSDKHFLEWADTCVLVLPSGRSSHLEAGWIAGKGLELHVYLMEKVEPDLMYKLATKIHTTLDSLLDTLR